MQSPLNNTVRIAAELRARLVEEYQLSDDDAALDDTILGECDLDEQLGRIAREANRAEAFAEGLAGLIKVEQDRKARLERKAEKLRSLIAWSMGEAGIKKVPLPDMTLSLGSGKPPLIVDEQAEIPDLYLRFPAPQPDKTAIRSALHSGAVLPFAKFGNAAPVLTIRKS